MRILITGAARGIGAAVVGRLKKSDCEIVALDIVEPTGVDHWVPTDMCDPESINDAVKSLTGSFDCLINNAGVPPRQGMAQSVLQINFVGMAQLTHAVVPMINPNGSIVTTASRAGAFWRDNLAEVKALMDCSPNELDAFVAKYGIDDVRAYNLSKEAAIFWSMAQTEHLLTKDIRINTVSPAAVDTEILSDFVNAFGDKVSENLKRVGRAGTATEIAEVIVFLASPASGWIKGNDISVDGGMTAINTCNVLAFQPHS